MVALVIHRVLNSDALPDPLAVEEEDRREAAQAFKTAIDQFGALEEQLELMQTQAFRQMQTSSPNVETAEQALSQAGLMARQREHGLLCS